MDARQTCAASPSGVAVGAALLLGLLLVGCSTYPADFTLEMRKINETGGVREESIVDITYRDGRATAIRQGFALTQGDFSLQCVEHYDLEQDIWVMDSRSPGMRATRCVDAPLLLTREDVVRAIDDWTLMNGACTTRWCYEIRPEGQPY